jgi:hypothetical protein
MCFSQNWLVVSVQEFDGICLREVRAGARENNIAYEKCDIKRELS